jgi:hypothetical protein
MKVVNRKNGQRPYLGSLDISGLNIYVFFSLLSTIMLATPSCFVSLHIW